MHLDLPEVFNNFFISKISKIRLALDSESTEANQFCQSVIAKGKFSSFRPLSKGEVKSLVLSSPPKSCQLDPIPTDLLFKHIDTVIDVLTAIVNNSLESGVMPPCFKKAIISPLIKKQNLDQNILKNYRPVSNLSFISKIIEKAVCSQMNEYLSSFSLFEKHQSAYRKFHNTETALVKITNDLLLAADDKKVSVVVLLDLSAAFDTIDHRILINRLKDDFGFDSKVLDWFFSYLNDRTQQVKINYFYLLR